MASETKDLLSNPLPLMAVALLAAGVLVRTLPLESARPHDAVPPAASAIGEQDVRARLWQDPFEVVPRAARRESREERLVRFGKDLLHQPDSLTLQLERATKEGNPKVTVLGVMVFGTPYAEDVETRRRMRYAVLSGLAARHYVPDNPGALGYIWTEPTAGARLPEVVPYEWFTAEPSKRDAKQIPGGEKLLVLWLDEDAFGDEALTSLSALFQRVACGRVKASCQVRDKLEPVRILGPAELGDAQVDLREGAHPGDTSGGTVQPAVRVRVRHRAEGEARGVAVGVGPETHRAADDRRRRRSRAGTPRGARTPARKPDRR